MIQIDSTEMVTDKIKRKCSLVSLEFKLFFGKKYFEENRTPLFQCLSDGFLKTGNLKSSCHFLVLTSLYYDLLSLKKKMFLDFKYNLYDTLMNLISF